MHTEICKCATDIQMHVFLVERKYQGRLIKTDNNTETFTLYLTTLINMHVHTHTQVGNMSVICTCEEFGRLRLTLQLLARCVCVSSGQEGGRPGEWDR